MNANRELLGFCLRGERWPEGLFRRVLDEATGGRPDRAIEASRSFFSNVIEPLSDSFDPSLCEPYAALFSEVIARLVPGFRAEELFQRYRRVRRGRRFEGDAENVQKVFVLSRVTLGADVSITSVILDAMKRRFPAAEILLAGSRKSWELFQADGSVQHLDVEYGRAGTLVDRLSVGAGLREAFSEPGSIVVDPDSRITQLGVLPVCPEENYYFFESRSYGGDGDLPLPELTRQWCEETFGVADAAPFIAPAHCAPPDGDYVSVSLGVGPNPSKRVPDPFEERLVRALLERGESVLIDKGAPGEESARVERILEACGGNARLRHWEGSFAPFASLIATSSLYLGYDSAGQHVAAAAGVPLVSVFAGFASRRMFHRWKAHGRGPIEVLPVERPEPERVLEQTLEAVARLRG